MTQTDRGGNWSTRCPQPSSFAAGTVGDWDCDDWRRPAAACGALSEEFVLKSGWRISDEARRGWWRVDALQIRGCALLIRQALESLASARLCRPTPCCRSLSTRCQLRRSGRHFLSAQPNDSAKLWASSGRYHVTKMAEIGFWLRFFAVCLLSAFMIETSTAENPIQSVDMWGLPDAQAVVGKLFRYRVTSNRPCAAHYKVISTSYFVIHLPEMFQNFLDFLNLS